jgi:hypothetical protein
MFPLIKDKSYLLKMKKEITRYVARCRIFQMAKGHSQNTGLFLICIYSMGTI